MKKIYSFLLVAMLALTAQTQAPVTISELRGTWVFRGVASDWQNMGEILPTVHTFTISVDETTNKVTATTSIGDVWAFGAAEDGSEDYIDALHGSYNPETQVLTFTDTYDEEAGIYTYIMDEYYAFYAYDLAFRADRDEAGNVVLQMVPTANNSMLVLAYGAYDDAGNYNWYYYGYDLGATMTAPQAGELEAGEYEIAGQNLDGSNITLPCEIKSTDAGLVLAINDVECALTAKSQGFGANKKTYAYTVSSAYTVFGEGEYDYYFNFISYYLGGYDVTFFSDGNGMFTCDQSIYMESADGTSTVVLNPILGKKGTTAVKDVIATEGNGKAEYFDLQGRRISRPTGLYIEKVNGKVTKRLAK